MSSLDRETILDKTEPISTLIFLFFLDKYINTLKKLE